MKTPRLQSRLLSRLPILALPAVLLCGCLEVQQHPKWINGEYAGKPDNLPSQARFHGDKLAWAAAIANRNQLQNEYGRTGPGDTEAIGGPAPTGSGTTGVAGPAGAASGSPESPATKPSTASPASAAPAQATPADNKRAPAGNAKP